MPERKNLDQREYFLRESNTNNPYLNLNGLDDVVGSGFHSFYIVGSQYLRKGSQIEFEMIDSDGEPIQINAIRNIRKGNARVVSFSINRDVSNGGATLYVSSVLNDYMDEDGNVQGVPSEFSNQANLLFTYNFTVDKDKINSDDIVFRKQPQLSINPTIKEVEKVKKDSVTLDTGSSGAPLTGSIVDIEQISESEYAVEFEADESVFNAEMGRGTIRFIDRKFDGGTFSYIDYQKYPTNNGYKGDIQYVKNGKTIRAVFRNPDISTFGSGKDASYVNTFIPEGHDITFEVDYTTIPSNEETLIQQRTYADFQLQDLHTVSGDPEIVKVYVKSDSEGTDYSLAHEGELDEQKSLLEVSDNYNIGIFDTGSKLNSWNVSDATNPNDTPSDPNPTLYLDNTKFLNGVVISGSDDVFTKQVEGNTLQTPLYSMESDTSLTLYRDIDYTIAMDTAVEDVIENDTRLDVYISGSGIPSDVGNRFGILVNSFRTNEDKVWRKDDITVDYNGDYTINDGKLIFVVTSGKWHLADISVKPQILEGYTVGEYRTKIPLNVLRKNQDFDFKVEFFDNAGNKANTTLYRNNVTFERPNLVIEGEHNVLTGSLFAGQNSGSGIEYSGEIAGGSMKSVGYEGFTSASQGTGPAGFLMFSGSVLPDSGDDYKGVGLDLVADSGSFFKYRTNPSELSIATDSFTLDATTAASGGIIIDSNASSLSLFAPNYPNEPVVNINAQANIPGNVLQLNDPNAVVEPPELTGTLKFGEHTVFGTPYQIVDDDIPVIVSYDLDFDIRSSGLAGLPFIKIVEGLRAGSWEKLYVGDVIDFQNKESYFTRLDNLVLDVNGYSHIRAGFRLDIDPITSDEVDYTLSNRVYGQYRGRLVINDRGVFYRIAPDKLISLGGSSNTLDIDEDDSSWKRFSKGMIENNSVGSITQNLNGFYTQIPAILNTYIRSGVEYMILSDSNGDLIPIIPTVDEEAGERTLNIEEQKIDAPAGSYIIRSNAYSEAESREFEERTDQLDEELNILDDNLEILDGYFNDPSTIPDNYSFFEGIVVEDAFIDTFVANEGYVDKLVVSSSFVDTLTANQGFIENLGALNITIEDSGSITVGIGGIIEAASGNWRLEEDYLFAQNAFIDGEIVANTGTIGGFSINSSSLYSSQFFLSGSATGNDYFISSSNWNVKASGDMTGSAVLLDGGTIGGFDLSSTEIKSSNNLLRLKATGQITASSGLIGGFDVLSNEIKSSNDNLRLKASGEITGSQVLFTGGTIGGWTISDTFISSSGLIINSNGTISTSNFADGVEGWQITSAGNGSAQFENVKIRGTLKTTVFEKETVNAVGGQLFVGNSTTLTADVSSGDTVLPVENVTGFTAGEILLIKRQESSGFNAEYVEVQSTSRNDANSSTDFSGTLTVQRGYGAGQGTSDTWVSELASSATNYTEGQVITSTGEVGSGWILLNATPTDTNYTPYIDIVERTGSGVYDYELKARLGDLSGLSQTRLLGVDPQNAGFGLYSENVFLEGGIRATFGEIGGWSINSTTLTSGDSGITLDASNNKIYVGTGTYNNPNTSFYVDSSNRFSLGNKLTFDGSNLSITGTITAGDGSIGGWNINPSTISKNNVTLDSSTNNGQILVGTQGDYWRGNNTFSFGNGKLTYNGTTLSISGNNVSIDGGAITLDGNTTVNGTFSLNDGTAGGWTINASNIKGGNLYLYDTGIIRNTNTINGTNAYELGSSGDGQLAGGRVNWTTGGDLTITGSITATSGELQNLDITGALTMQAGSTVRLPDAPNTTANGWFDQDGLTFPAVTTQNISWGVSVTAGFDGASIVGTTTQLESRTGLELNSFRRTFDDRYWPIYINGFPTYRMDPDDVTGVGGPFTLNMTTPVRRVYPSTGDITFDRIELVGGDVSPEPGMVIWVINTSSNNIYYTDGGNIVERQGGGNMTQGGYSVTAFVYEGFNWYKMMDHGD